MLYTIYTHTYTQVVSVCNWGMYMIDCRPMHQPGDQHGACHVFHTQRFVDMGTTVVVRPSKINCLFRVNFSKFEGR
jgi:hypothetical protein